MSDRNTTTHPQDIAPEHCLTYHKKYSSPHRDATVYRCRGFYNPADVTMVEEYAEADRYALYFSNGKYIFLNGLDFEQYADWLQANPLRIVDVSCAGQNVVARLSDGSFAVRTPDGEWEAIQDLNVG